MKIKLRKSCICGIKGLKLSKNEHKFIKKYRPWGIILFKRNIKNIKQTSELTKSIKKIFKDPYYPVLIDRFRRSEGIDEWLKDKQIEIDPEVIRQSPIKTPVRRLDETRANRELNLRWVG